MVASSGPPPAGVIIPPPELRTIVDKTASFVARVGQSFEEKIKEAEKANPKFCFLDTNDHYHAYYQWKIQDVRTSDASGGPGKTFFLSYTQSSNQILFDHCLVEENC
tara:strand:- start:422 stop:742 length:321 start_codon:yes stop_codon:yes gene_type:complete